MKRWNNRKLLVLVFVFLLAFNLVGCAGNHSVTPETSITTEAETTAEESTGFVADDFFEQKETMIVTTIFPVYDFIRNVLGTDSEIGAEYLIHSGVDFHNYRPTAEDILKIQDAKLFFYIGGESDGWVEQLFESNPSLKAKSVNLMEAVEEAGFPLLHYHADEEKIVNHDHDHDEHAHEEKHDHDHDEHAHEEKHDHDHDEHAHEEKHDHDHDHEEHAHHDDEHIWLSLSIADKIVDIISDKVGELDPAHKDRYQANKKSYQEKLSELDTFFTLATKELDDKVMIVGDRFPFLYLVYDYDIKFHAAFDGCSAETEASFETMSRLTEKVNAIHPSVVFKLEDARHKIAETVIENSLYKDTKIAVLNSMQAVTLKQVHEGADYLKIMKANLQTLKEALAK